MALFVRKSFETSLGGLGRNGGRLEGLGLDRRRRRKGGVEVGIKRSVGVISADGVDVELGPRAPVIWNPPRLLMFGGRHCVLVAALNYIYSRRETGEMSRLTLGCINERLGAKTKDELLLLVVVKSGRSWS